MWWRHDVCYIWVSIVTSPRGAARGVMVSLTRTALSWPLWCAATLHSASCFVKPFDLYMENRWRIDQWQVLLDLTTIAHWHSSLSQGAVIIYVWGGTPTPKCIVSKLEHAREVKVGSPVNILTLLWDLLLICNHKVMSRAKMFYIWSSFPCQKGSIWVPVRFCPQEKWKYPVFQGDHEGVCPGMIN